MQPKSTQLQRDDEKELHQELLDSVSHSWDQLGSVGCVVAVGKWMETLKSTKSPRKRDSLKNSRRWVLQDIYIYTFTYIYIYIYTDIHVLSMYNSYLYITIIADDTSISAKLNDISEPHSWTEALSERRLQQEDALLGISPWYPPGFFTSK